MNPKEIENPIQAKSEKLKPCPFCGGKAELILRGNSFTKKRSAEIECMDCHVKRAVGAIRGTLEWCELIITNWWNQRTTDKLNEQEEHDFDKDLKYKKI